MSLRPFSVAFRSKIILPTKISFHWPCFWISWMMWTLFKTSLKDYSSGNAKNWKDLHKLKAQRLDEQPGAEAWKTLVLCRLDWVSCNSGQGKGPLWSEMDQLALIGEAFTCAALRQKACGSCWMGPYHTIQSPKPESAAPSWASQNLSFRHLDTGERGSSKCPHLIKLAVSFVYKGSRECEM